MSSFKCPHNEDVQIHDKCIITECPYHVDRVSKLFKIEQGETGCVYYDSDIMQNVSNSRTQISALSRDPRRLLSPKLIRSAFETALESGKTLYALTHNVSNSKHSCRNCGYPRDKGFKCISDETCKFRKEWVKFVCSHYKIEPVITNFQIIWELLFKNEISLNEMSLKVGFSLCNKPDVLNNPNVPQHMLESSSSP